MPIASGIQPNIFRAVSGSLFSSPVNWSRGFVPTGSDVAMIADNCTIDISRTIGSLIVKAPFTASINTGLTLNISQSINVLGHLSCSGTPTINILGVKSNIRSLSPGTSTFNYSSPFNQTAAGALYYNLQTLKPRGGPRVSLSGNLIVSGNFYVGYGDADGISVGSFGPFDLGLYNLTVFGTSSVDSTLIKSGFGYITFEGPLIFGPTSNNQNQGINFSGNPIVEFKRGVTYFSGYGTTYGGVFNTGEGIWKFSTNNQDIKLRNSARNFTANILISGPITASYTDGTGTYILKSINGDHPSSSFANAGTLYLAGDNITPMVTGTFDHLTYTGSTIGYVANLTQTLPYNTYANLYIDGIGTKALSGSNTTVRKTLYVGNIGTGETILYTTFNVSSSNLIVSGTTSIDGKFSKTGPGSMLFMGTYYQNTGLGNNRQGTFDFSGNPTVEFQNGFETGNAYGLRDNAINTGTGSWIFSTNSQNFNIWAAGGGVNFQYISASIVISGSITVRYGNTTGNAKGSGIYFLNKIDGTIPSSLFINSGSLYFASAVACSGSFLTASLNTTYIGNTVGFASNYSATIPTRFNTFYNLYVAGTGVKTLGTSSFVSNSLSIDGNGYLNMSSSNLTVNGTLTTGISSATMSLGTGNLYVSGTSTVWQLSKIITSASNNVTFNGLLDFRDYGVAETLLDFSLGNPNVEVRNGIYTNQGTNPNTIRSGFGTWSFTTNNQALTGQFAGTSNLTFTGSVIVSGAITLSNRARTNIYQPINGTDPNSKFENFTNSILGVYTTSSLMTTGILDIKTYPNTVLYAMEGNYVIPYQSYRSLQIGGSGVKSINQNTDLTGSLYVGSSGIGASTFELFSYNLFVSGTTSVINARMYKSGSGNIIFNDLVTFWDYGAAYIIDFSLGNPNVEFRNGLYATNQGSVLGSINSGTGSWTFSTNNQTLTGASTNLGVTIKAPITISGPITFTVNLTPTFSGSINGDNANSKLLMATNSTIYYTNSATPMLTGILDVTSSLGTTFIYASGSQNVKGGIYRNLTFLNGLKTLQGNVSVLGTFSTGSGATSGSYNLNGFTLTNP